MSLRYDRVTCNRFVDDMEQIGLEPAHVNGRNHWSGPGVTVDNRRVDKVRDATDVTTMIEPIGKGWSLIHPVVSGKLKGGRG